MKQLTFLFFSIALFVFFACQNETSKKEKLRIAVASSSQFAINEIVAVFEKENNAKVSLITAASGKLALQILNGAPYDIFIAANMFYPQTLFEKGKALTKPKNYGFGVPVLWTLDESLTLHTDGQFLLQPKVKKIAIANPKNAPYGKIAMQYMKDKLLYDSLQSKLVYGENISLVNEYILNRTATIGVSAKSIVYSSKLKKQGYYLALGEKYRIAQGIVALKNTPATEMKQKFMDFMFEEKAKTILKQYGYEK